MKNLISHLSQFISEQRLQTFEKVLEQRTRYITVALEDIYQSQNASAVLRTCDCLGVQDAHIIENRNLFHLNPDVVLGSSQWLNIYKYRKKENNTIEAVKQIREKGYRIVATSPHINEQKLEEIDLSHGKIALFFGTERRGLTKTLMDMADEYLQIPIVGFTESFNLSVSAAIILHHLTLNLRQSDLDWKLADEEKDELMLNWLRKSIRKSELIEKEFNKRTFSNPDYGKS
jgi:tRNA (guanosine-2'-O-)-methyltransferase